MDTTVAADDGGGTVRKVWPIAVASRAPSTRGRASARSRSVTMPPAARISAASVRTVSPA